MDAPANYEFSDSESSYEEFITLMLNYTSVWRKRKRGGSRPRRSANVERDAQARHQRLWRDYFCESPRYSGQIFECRFRMKRSLFVQVMEAAVACDPEFEQLYDETIRGAENTILYYTKRFCEAVIHAFESEYLRELSRSDIETQLQSSEQRGFPGCLGSLDCMHWSFEFTAAGKQFDQLYHQVDGIYPQYSCFVSTISKPANVKQKKFAERQDPFRKDVENPSGVLRAKFPILKQPSKTWDTAGLLIIMNACVILHNMIVENNYENGIDPAAVLRRRRAKLVSTSQTLIPSMKPIQIATPT
ncbi:hypothetical protein PC121_g9749 [Phytophthora cactorum]|nr:hypothetical protein PC120_g7674 [Phytophthora cactorum]KAG3069618.1 hypothetical protein PC121_g9749 [Phytophthora cactorum]KAG4055453.1 hypothetical protein PC123_g9439 [Phytophthora cactorum]